MFIIFYIPSLAKFEIKENAYKKDIFFNKVKVFEDIFNKLLINYIYLIFRIYIKVYSSCLHFERFCIVSFEFQRSHSVGVQWCKL